MAEMTDEEWERLHEGFDTRRLLDAVGDVDELRGYLSNDGLRPPEIRDRLLKLHELAMEVINEGVQERAVKLFDRAGELEDEVFDILEAATRLHAALTALTDLRPESLDDEGYGSGEGDEEDDIAD